MQKKNAYAGLNLSLFSIIVSYLQIYLKPLLHNMKQVPTLNLQSPNNLQKRVSSTAFISIDLRSSFYLLFLLLFGNYFFQHKRLLSLLFLERLLECSLFNRNLERLFSFLLLYRICALTQWGLYLTFSDDEDCCFFFRDKHFHVQLLFQVQLFIKVQLIKNQSDK
jgi:hypothetical protein